MRHVPMTISHEVAGVAVAVGERVIGLAAGTRVGVRSGPDGAGWAYHGGFAELMAAPAEHVVKAPEHVPFSHLAVGGDARHGGPPCRRTTSGRGTLSPDRNHRTRRARHRGVH